MRQVAAEVDRLRKEAEVDIRSMDDRHSLVTPQHLQVGMLRCWHYVKFCLKYMKLFYLKWTANGTLARGNLSYSHVKCWHSRDT